MKEFKQKLIVLNNCLANIRNLAREKLNEDLTHFDMNSKAGTTRLDMLGNIDRLVEGMQLTASEIEICIGIAEDMEKGLEVKDGIQNTKTR